MHEVSIAESLIALIRRHLPAHQRLIRATVRIGPMHGVVPEAMEMAWNIASADAGWSGSRLRIVSPPWRLRCVACGRCWEPITVDEPCVCGGTHVDILGGDEFQLDSIDVDSTAMHRRKKTAKSGGGRQRTFKTGVDHEHQSSHR